MIKTYAYGSVVRKPKYDTTKIKNKKKADINNDGELSSYEVARGKKIEAAMAKRRTA